MTKLSLRVVEGGAENGAEESGDPLIEECVADALAPYRDLLTPAEVEEHRRLLTLFILTHPEAAKLYDRLRERNVGNASGDVPKEEWSNGSVPEVLRPQADGGKR